MVDFPVNVKNGVNKRIADETIKQFEANEFNVSCKELSLKRAILVHDSYFTVYESEYRGSAVSVKVVAVDEKQQISDFIDALVDLTSLASLPHDNISAFYGAGYTLNSENKLREIMIVTEPFERGTLRSLLKKSLDWAAKMSIARDIARAISHLHDKSVIHGDIRTSTILVNEQNQAKLVDFAHLCGERSRLETRTFNTSKGTVALSPEMARNQMYDFAADVYAFGMLLFELITETPPNKKFRYRNAHSGFALLEDELRAAVKPGCPTGLEALAYSCCETKAARRLVAPQIVDELDFLLIELTRKPEDDVRISPLKRTSSATNKYAHLLLPSPSSAKNLLAAKVSTAEEKNGPSNGVVSSPVATAAVSEVGGLGGPVQGKTELEKVMEHEDEGESETPHSNNSAEVSTTKPDHNTDTRDGEERVEADQEPATQVTLAPVVETEATENPQRRSSLPLSTTSHADSSKPVEKPVVETADNLQSDFVSPAVMVGGKNKRRKGMIDPSTAHIEEPVPHTAPAEPTESTQPAESAEPVEILTADEALSLISTIKHIVHDALEPGVDATGEVPLTADEVSHISLEPLVDEGTNTSPRAGAAEKFVFVSEKVTDSEASPDASNPPSSPIPVSVDAALESTTSKKKKSRSRAKIDYAAETPLQTELPTTAPELPQEEAPATPVNDKIIFGEEKSEFPVVSAAKSASTVPVESGRKESTSVVFEPAPARNASASETTPSAQEPAPEAQIIPDQPATAPVVVPTPAAVPQTAPPTAPALQEAAVERRRSILLPPGEYINISDMMVDSPLPYRKEDRYNDTTWGVPDPVHSAPVIIEEVETESEELAQGREKSASEVADVVEVAEMTVELNMPEKIAPEKKSAESAKSVATLPLEPILPNIAHSAEYVAEPLVPQEEESKAPVFSTPSLPPAGTSEVVLSTPASVTTTTTATPTPLPSPFAFSSSAAQAVSASAPAASAKAGRAGAGRASQADSQPVPIPATIRATEAVMAAVSAVVKPSLIAESANPIVEPSTEAVPPVEEVITTSATKRTRGTRGGKGRNKHKQSDNTVTEPAVSVLVSPAEPTLSEISVSVLTPRGQKGTSARPSGKFDDIFSPTTTDSSAAAVTCQSGEDAEWDKSLRNEHSGSSQGFPAPQALPAPRSPMTKVETSLFQSPLAEKSGLNSNQKRRLRREQARAAAAAFVSAADAAAQEVIVQPTGRGEAGEALQVNTLVHGDESNNVEQPVVLTPKHAPPPVPTVSTVVVASPSVALVEPVEPVMAEEKGTAPVSSAVSDSAEQAVSKEPLSSPPRTANNNDVSASATVSTPPVRLHTSPLRSPNGALPIPAPHRHMHHFDLPTPQVTPPLHFPVSANALAKLPEEPASPGSPIPGKLDTAQRSESTPKVFSDADHNISVGEKEAVQQVVYSTPHRTVEKINRFNVLAAADDSHHKSHSTHHSASAHALRSKVLSPAAASQRAVLQATSVPVSASSMPVTAQGASAYEERLLAMERRLQALAEENRLLQRDLQAAVHKQAASELAPVVVEPPTPQTVVDVVSGTPSAQLSEVVPASLHAVESAPAPPAVTALSASAASPTLIARSPARSSLGAVLQQFESFALSVAEENTEAIVKEKQDESGSDVEEESKEQSQGDSEDDEESSQDKEGTEDGYGSESENKGKSDSERELDGEGGQRKVPMMTAEEMATEVSLESSAELTATVVTPSVDPSAFTASVSLPSATPITPAAGPTGIVDVLKYLEAMQSDLRAQLSTLQTPVAASPAVSSVPAVPSTPSLGASAPPSTPFTAGLQEPAPSTPAVVPLSTAEAELQLQTQIAAVIDSKLGAVQAQISQFSSLLNAILLAQSPQRAPHSAQDDLSLINSQNSTHSSAFVTPNSVLGSLSQPFEGEEDEEHDPPGASPGGHSLGPQKLFSQVDPTSVGYEDMPGLIPSSDFQPFVARRASEGQSQQEVTLETIETEESCFAPRAQLFSSETTQDNDKDNNSPTTDSERHRYVQEEEFNPTEEEGDNEYNDQNDGEEYQHRNVAESPLSTEGEIDQIGSEQESEKEEFVPSALTFVPVQEVSEPALPPLHPASEVSSAPVRKSLSPPVQGENANNSTSISNSALLNTSLEEAPLEAWEIKAKSVTALRGASASPSVPSASPSSVPLFIPASSTPAGAPMKPPKPGKASAGLPAVGSGGADNADNVSNATTGVTVDTVAVVTENAAHPTHDDKSADVTPDAEDTETSGLLPTEHEHEYELESLPAPVTDAITVTSFNIDKSANTAPSGPSSRAPTPSSEGRASPFLRNKIPFPLSAHDGAHSQFPKLYGEPEPSVVPEPKLVEDVNIVKQADPVKDVVLSIAERDAVKSEPSTVEKTAVAAPTSAEKEDSQNVASQSGACGSDDSEAPPPAPPVESAVSTPSSTAPSAASRESSVIDAADIEYPYTLEHSDVLHQENDTQRSLPAAVLALHRHHENQQRELLMYQEQQLQDELALARGAYGAYHHSVPPALNYSQGSVHRQHGHKHSAHSPQPELSSPKQDTPPAKGLSTSMKFLDELSKLNSHYDAKEDQAQGLSVPNRKPLDYSRTPNGTQVDLRQPQVGQPHLSVHAQSHPHLYVHPSTHSNEKHLRVSPQSSQVRIGDGYPQQPTYPLSTAHVVHHHNPLLRSTTPPALQRPLIHSDPYLEHHTHQAHQAHHVEAKSPTDPFQSPAPQRTYGTPQINTQSTLSNSGGDRSRHHESHHHTPYQQLHQAHTPQQSVSPYSMYNPHSRQNVYDLHEGYGSPAPEDEEDVSTQRLADLTGVLNNFLSVIEKCGEISDSADLAVSRLDQNMSRLDQRSHRRILGDQGNKNKSDLGTSVTRSASFAPHLSYYEPPPPPPPHSPPARYNSTGNIRLDDEYDAKYVEYDGSDDERSTARSRAGSVSVRSVRSVSRSRANSAANFDSTSNITREPVHTKHHLSPAKKPALIRFDQSASQPSLNPANSFSRPSNNNYFKAALGGPANNTKNNNNSSVSVSGRSAVSKSPSATRKPEGLPNRKAPVPVQGNRAGRSTNQTRTERATSFASTIGTVVSGLSSVGGESDRAPSQHQHQQQPSAPHQNVHLYRSTSFGDQLRRSSDSDNGQIIVDGRVQALRRNASQQSLSASNGGVLRQSSNDSQLSSRSNSPRSRPTSPRSARSQSPRLDRVPSPKEIQSKFKNVTAHAFRADTSPRRIS